MQSYDTITTVDGATLAIQFVVFQGRLVPCGAVAVSLAGNITNLIASAVADAISGDQMVAYKIHGQDAFTYIK